MKKTDAQLKLFISAIFVVLFMIIPASAENVIPAYTGVYVQTSNDDGILYDYTGNGTYYILSNGGGLNAVHITTNFTEPDGQVTVSENQSGTFWITDTGGRGYQDDMVLLLAINGTIPDDFGVRIKTGGYTWTPGAVADTAPAAGVPVYNDTALDETFTKNDLIYGPQSWKPQGSDAIYPLFYGEDTDDAVNQFCLAFIDTRAGVLGTQYSGYSDLTDQGSVKVEYEFTNLNGYAAFNVYGWNNATSKGRGMGWTNCVSGDGSSGYSVVGTPAGPVAEVPVASFEAGSTWGEVPFNVKFTDTSSGNPTSWLWGFGDGGSSTDQNTTHIYSTAGTYTVTLTATNSAGSNTTTLTDYITVTEAGSSLLADSAWPEYGYDSQNTGRSPYNGPQTATLNWSSNIGSIFYSNSGIAIGSDETIYTTSYSDKSLYALYPNGTQKWTYNTGYDMSGMPAVSSDGTIYVSAASILYAVNSDGTQKWMLNGASNWGTNVVIGPDGIIYSGSHSNLSAINPNGTLKWSYTTGGTVWYAGAAFGSDGTIYIGSKDKYLYALNPDGSLKWRYLTAGAVDTAPSVGSDGTIYIGSQDNCLYAINPDGTLKWKYNSGYMFSIGSTAIGSDGTIYIGTFDGGKFLALNPDGALKWSTSVDTHTIVTPAIGSDGAIYFGSWTTQTSGNIYCLNPDGSLKWKYPVSSWIVLSPAIAPDGTLYTGSFDGNIYAIENVVDFTTDKTSGESQLIVQFSGTSSRAVSSWTWDFGDGTNSTGQNPSHTYTSDGSYNVTLTITEDGTGETFTAEKPGYIKAYTKPVAAFSAGTTSGQVPMTVNFSDESTNNPTEWLWDFGDGNTSVEQSPEYTYLAAGTYSVTLIVENPAGNSTEVKNNYITVDAQPIPVVGFNASVTEGQAPLEVDFTDLSTGSPISWSWDFGNGVTSDEQNPAFTYTVPGLYTVGLFAENYGGSNNTIRVDYINVTPQDPPVASFDATNVTITGDSAANTMPVPLTVRFTQNATGYNITAYLWDFGDGINSTEENPVHIYESPGDYNISLAVLNDGGMDTEFLNLTIAGILTPVADFSVNKTYGKNPLTVQFIDESLYSPTSWSWNFGDGESSNEQNPVHTYTGIGTYNISLTATNPAGSNTTVKTDYVTSATTNAQPLSNYRNINIYVANDEGVKWDEPDGITRYEGIGIPYNYVPNTYFVLFGTAGGGSNPMDISSVPDGVKGSEGQITETHDQSGEFWVTFNGGQTYMHEGILMLAVNGTIPEDFSVHIRSSGYAFGLPIPGVGNNDSVSTPVYVEGAVDQTFTTDDFIYGPQIWKPFGTENYPIYTGQDMTDTENTFQLMFIDLDLGATKTGTDQGSIKVEYEFSNLSSFAVFNSYGWYRVSNHGTGIIMTNCGSYYAVMPVTEAPVAAFNVSSTVGDALVPLQFTDSSLNYPQSWFWDFGDGTNSTEESPEHTYTLAGNYTVTLTVTNGRGADSASINVVQNVGPAPVVGFSADSTTGSSPFRVNFTDESTNSPIEWLWDFGDGTNSTGQNPVHWYGPGNYSVSLTATNAGGNDTLVKENYITVSQHTSPDVIANPDFETGDFTGWESGPFASVSSSRQYNGSYSAYITVTDDTYTGEDPYSKHYIAQYVDLTNVSKISFYGYLSSAWGTEYLKTYVDGALVQTDTVNPSGWNKYTVYIGGAYPGAHELRIGYDRNSYLVGMYLDTLSTESWTTVPTVNFTVSNTTGPIPLLVEFTDASVSAVAWHWDFGDNTTSEEQNPSHTYTVSGNYTVTLTASNEHGNSSYVRHVLATEVPVTGFSATPRFGISSLTVDFTDESTNTPTEWLWDFGDGTTSGEQNPSHTYSAGTYTVSLTAKNSHGSSTKILTNYISVSSEEGVLLADTVWPEFGYNSMHTGLSPVDGPQAAVEKWNISLGGAVKYSGPAIDTDGTIYIGSYGDNKLHVINPDGTQKWEFTAGDNIYNTPAISADGTVYFGSYDGNLYALYPDGTEKWRFNNGGRNFGSPTIGSDGTIYFGSRDYKVYAVNPDGTEKWNYTTGNYIYGSPAIGTDGMVYVGGYDNNLYAINPDGTLNWTYAATDRTYMSPVIGSGGTIYFGTYTSGKTVYAVNPNGSLKWEKNIGYGLYYGSAAIGPDGTIYIPSYQGKFVMALDPGDGTEKWTYSLGGSVYSSPVIGSDGTLYIGTTGGKKICAINPDGTEKWEYYTGVSFYGTPAIGPDGTLYIGDYNGILYAFENVVDFTSDKTTGESPLTIQFTGTSPRTVSSWHWDFGDGTTSTGQTPSHTYTVGGNYKVTLTITEEGTGETFSAVKPGHISFDSAPLADFIADPVTGEFPLTVCFNDTSGGFPTEWSWDFDNDGVADSTEQNPSYTYDTTGTYSVSLTVGNYLGTTSTLKENYIAVKGLQKTTTNVPVQNNGTLTNDGNGNKQYSINQSEAQVSGNNIVIDSGNYKITIKSDNAPATTGGNIVANVTGIELETDPIEAVLDELGNVSGSVDLELNDLPGDSKLEVTIEKGNSGKGAAFQIAANSGGLNVENIAYTMNIVKTNLTNGQEIKEAKITMSVPESWVGANGGKDAIKIIRIAEDGKKEVLDTTWIKTNNGIMFFEGYSPNGLSIFGLVSTTEQPPSSPSYVGGGSLASSAGGQSDIGIDGVENMKAGDMATLYFDETSIYEMDLYAKEDIPKVFITVEAGIMPEGAGSPEGDVYEYIAALLYDTGAESVSKYTVRFGLPSDWVNSRLSTPDLLSLYYYDEGNDEWTKLSTVYDSEKNDVCYFYADTASFGYLAIAALPDLDHAKPSSLKSEVTEQPTLAEESVSDAKPVPTAKATPLFGGIIVFVALAMVCLIAAANRICRREK